MRIIAGVKRGFKLYTPPKQTRPTQEKVRGAIFNILSNRIDQAQVLDLFCGSGALGLEALSRGAKGATFVDIDVRPVTVNLKKLDFANAKVVKGNVFRKAKSLPTAAFDLIFIDPPYNQDLVSRAVISVLDLLTKSGIIIAEHHRKEALTIPPNYLLYKEKLYGDTRVSFISRGDLE